MGVVVKIPLDEDHGSAFVAAAAGEIAEGTDQVGELTGGGALAGHTALQIRILMEDGILYRGAKILAAETGVVVIGQILDLQLIRRSQQPGGAGGETTGSASSQI